MNSFETKWQIKNVGIAKNLKTNFCLLFMPLFVGNLWYLSENFLVKSNEIHTKIQKVFKSSRFFENFMVVENLTSEDEHFKN